MPKPINFFLSRARIHHAKHSRVTFEDLASFFQQLSTLLDAGTPLLSALRLYAEQSESLRLGKAIREVSNQIAGGRSFYRSAANHPDIFQVHWLYMLRTGEAAGRLKEVMAQLSVGIQRSRVTRNKIISALIYPAILLAVAVASFSIMVLKVVPTFQQFFNDFGGQLPQLTQYVIALSSLIRTKGLYLLALAAAAGFGLRRYLKTPDGQTMFRSIIIAVPLVGDIYIQTAMEKFAYTMKLLLESGCPLLEALRTTEEVFKADALYCNALASAHASISRGNTLTAALWGTHLFTSMTLNMVKVGEESGTLPHVLDQLALYYGARVELLVQRLTALLEPCIVIFMGLFMGGMLASLYIPMFELAGGGAVK
jgi:type IV pilus assembly protein PilC